MTLKSGKMKYFYPVIRKVITSFLSVSLILLAYSPYTSAQYPGINDSIAKYRKGELIIKAKKGSKVTVEQMRHEFWFGCAIPNSFPGNMSENNLKLFKEHFLQYFNCAVTENAVKWMYMERNKGEVNYDIVDAILKWCDENDIPVRGHNIFWGKTRYIQPWLMELNNDELKQAIQQRAESLTRHYKGRFAEYDLNNEMLDENYYEERLGPDITRLMAQWALNGDPDAKLFLNEHDVLIPDSPAGTKLAAYMALIRSVLRQGIPITGLGIQGHSHLNTFDRQALIRGLDSLAIFKLPIRITEFNMPGRGYPSQDMSNKVLTPLEEETKAKDITDYYKICFAHPAVEGILMWGFWEGADWIPPSSLFKRDWTPTPAAEAYENLVLKEWWTRVSGTTNKKGEFSTQAFFGEYRVTVNGVSKEVDLTKAQGKVIVDMRK